MNDPQPEGHMASHIGRRKFLATLGGAAAWPLVASAQDRTVPLIGFLNSASPSPFARLVDAFRQGLREGGYVEGRNVRIEYRWAEGQFARLPELAADLVHRRVSLIVVAGGTVSARAAKEATATIPVLFIVGPNPIGDGLAENSEKGCRLAATEHPDVILMDLEMPDDDRWEVVRRLKNDPQTWDIPIIGMSAHAVESEREKAIATGCDEFDAKPIEFESLVATIGRVLAPHE